MAGILFKGTLQWFILIIVYLGCIPIDWFTNAEEVASGQVSDYHYQATVPIKGPYTALHTWYGLREMQCASKCSSRSGCIAFLWDPSDGQCVAIGNDWQSGEHTDSTTTPNPTSSSQSLHFYTNTKYGHLFPAAESGSGSGELSTPKPLPCPAQTGYRRVSFRDLTRCVFISSNFSTYDEARVTCEGHGGRLFKVNSLDLLQLANTAALEKGFPGDADNGLITTLRYFIGLDDLEVEDTFVWSDGQVMTSWEREDLFQAPYPDNYQDEDCVIVPNLVNFSLLSDVQCDDVFRFACEIVV